ncbi:GBS Bsp-like repeat-containing protein [Gorillibacterium sp. sgz5001074]|uniref:glycoside hydrolase family 78 protein n=1 Tax=Gorillibacterium sp. sgz5001074 TaxID=3446695 RepID=UPI003F678F0B
MIRKVLLQFVCIVLVFVYTIPTTSYANSTALVQTTNVQGNFKLPKGLVEVVDKRTRNTKLFQRPDGTYQVEIHFDDIHYEDSNGKWHDINTKIVDEADIDPAVMSLPKEIDKEICAVTRQMQQKSKRSNIQRASTNYRVLGVPFEVKLPKRIQDGYSLGKGQDQLTFKPVMQGHISSVTNSVYSVMNMTSKEPNVSRLNENGLIYHGVWQNTDIELQVLSYGLKESIILQTNDAPKSFSFEVEGALNSSLRAGELQLQPAWLVDAKGVIRNVEQIIRYEDNRMYIDLVPDTSGLDYPITIDPTVVVSPYESWEYFNDNSSDTTYWRPTIRQYLTSMTDDGGDNITESALRIDLSNIPQNATILNANLYTYIYSSLPGETTQIGKRVFLPNRTIGNEGSYVQIKIPAGNRFSDVNTDITNFIKDMRTYGGNGIYFLRSPESTILANYTFTDASKRPSVTIVYNVNPNAPGALSPNGTNTSPAIITSSIPTLAWSFTDPDSGNYQTQYQIQIYQDGTGSLVHDSGIVTSGTSSYTVPSGILVRGYTYRWQVRTWDNSGFASTYSNYAYFRLNSLPIASITSYTDGQQINDNVITLSWNYSDSDNHGQKMYQIIGSKDNWTSWAYNSGEVSSTTQQHQTIALSSGEWDFGVRVWDGYEWSNWFNRSNIFINPLPDRAATVLSDTIPTTMEAGKTYNVSITVRNDGKLPWNETTSFRLGAIGESDPFATGRQLIANGQTIETGQQYTFNFSMSAPIGETGIGTKITDWRMVQDNAAIAWFGTSLEKTITVVDTIKPIATSVNGPSIVYKGNNIYEVYAYGVSDSGSSVKSVKFPTWSEKNGQDDLVWHEGENIGGGTWKATISFKDHKGDVGRYITDVYAYDYAGNSTLVGKVTPKIYGPKQYIYDQQGRLDYVILPYGEIQDYEYDATGNLIGITIN